MYVVRVFKDGKLYAMYDVYSGRDFSKVSAIYQNMMDGFPKSYFEITQEKVED